MSCFNKNLNEYKDLKNEFKSDLRVDSIITKWQTLNNTDRYPSVDEAKTFIENNKTAFNLQAKDFAEAIYGNLKNKGHISKFKDLYYVNNSRKDTWEYDEVILSNNINDIEKYLETNNIPKNSYSIKKKKTKNGWTAVFKVDVNVFTPTDIIQKSRGFDTPRTRKLIHHLTNIFPGLTVEYLSIPDARRKYEKLPASQKQRVNFDQVNSFFDPVSGNVVLINSRVSDEIAVEEVMHPFVDALFIDNKSLFDSLLEEAKQNFPQLRVEIENAYLDSKGFTQQYRNREFVTQALARHFKKEYEENPTKTFLDRIKEFLQWFSSVVNSLHRFITGNNISNFQRNLAYYRGDQALMEQEERFDAVEPTTTIKPGVQELFESNPELANAVYEALGFKDSIIEIPNKYELNKEYNLKSVINNLLNTENESINNIYKVLLNSIPSNLKLIYTKNIKQNANGQYNYLEDVIKLNINKLSHKTLIHEIIHALTHDTLLKNEEFNNKITALRKQAIQYFENNRPKAIQGSTKYALTSNDEFLAGLFNYKNLDFLNTLNNIPSENTTLLEKIKNVFKNLINEIANIAGIKLNENSLLYEVINELGAIKTEQITPQQKQQALQLYSQYLDTIFPNSKVKDIVYHGSRNKELNVFSLEQTRASQKQRYPNQDTVDAFFFTPSQRTAKAMTSDEATIYSILLDIKNPLKVTNKLAIDEGYPSMYATIAFTNSPKAIKKYRKKEYDAFDSVSNIANELVVFEPEQIHILGSKQDVEGFKEFVGKPSVESKNLDKRFNSTLQNRLVEFIEGLNIEVAIDPEVLKTFTVKGQNPRTAFDLLQKYLALPSDVTDKEVSLQTANIIYQFLGKKSILQTNLRASIENWSKYDEVYKKYKTKGVSHSFAKKQATLQFLAEIIELGATQNFNVESIENIDVDKNYFSRLGYKNPYEINAFKRLLNIVWNWINEHILRNKVNFILKEQELKNLAMDIVNDVYQKDYKKFIRKYADVDGKIIDLNTGEELEQKYYEETLNKDPFAKSIILSFFNNPFMDYKLSGSQVVRKYGKLLRALSEDLHDIDGIITLEQMRKEGNYLEMINWIDQRGLKLSNSNRTKTFKRELTKFLEEQSWYKNLKSLYPEWELKEAFIGRDHKDGESITITGIIPHPTEIDPETGKKKEYIIDFFVRTKEGSYPEIFDNYWKDWKQIFEAKVNMGRAKDINDLIYFEPFKKDKYKFTNRGFRYFTMESEQRKDSNLIEEEVTDGKQDIEGFKEFVNKTTQIQPAVYNLNISDINPNMKLSDVARMLNTSDIRFDLGARADDSIRYSLTPELQEVVDYAKSTANEIQKNRIDSLFSQATKVKETVTSLSAAATGPIVILNEANHKYYDLLDTTEIYRSTTERIKGKLSEDDLFNKKLNIDLGNDFDKILQGLASDKNIDQLPEMNVLNKEQLAEAYGMLRENLNELTRGGGVAIPQVVVYDKATKTAGTIDLLVVLPDGKLRIVDLKTSKNSINDMIAFEQLKAKAGSKGKLKYDKAYELGEDSDLRKLGVDKLSTRAQQGLQVNIYRRMLENMGYEVDMGDYGASTFHIKVGVEGRDAEQKFTGEFQSDDWIAHPVSQNEVYVNMLIPSRKNELLVAELEGLDKKSDSSLVNFEEELTEEEKQSEQLEEYPEYAAITEALQLYKGALIAKNKAIDTINSSVFMDRSRNETKEKILHSIASINIAMAQSPKERSELYTSFLRDVLKQYNTFIDYIKDPDNYSKPEYITYALNFERFAKTFEGLYSIKSSDDVNNTQALLITQIQIKLNELSLNTDGNQGLVNQAILNYVKDQIKNWSSRDDLSEDVLNDMMSEVSDIPMWEYLTDGMTTSSDTLLAIAAKIYAHKKQELLDRLTEKQNSILSAAKVLQELSTDKNPQNLYNFMLEFDEDGNPTGRYVRRLGKEYYKIQEELRKDFFSEDGNWLDYRDITDVSTASQEDIEFNIKLAEAKARYSDFWRAERFNDEGKLVSGAYHSYTEEFKKERAKYMNLVNNTGVPFWKKKDSVSDLDFLVFREKYYDEVEYTRAIKKNGKPTGAILRGEKFYAPKVKYRVANNYNTITGERIISERYEKIMNPTNALERAQKDFYILYDKYYNEYLEMLPMGERTRMLGKLPVINNRFFDDLKKKPNSVVKLWGKTVRSVKDFFITTAEQRAVAVDENGNIVDQLPVMFTGNPRKEGELEELQNKIDQLKEEFKNNKIRKREYDKKLELLQGQYIKLRNRPTVSEINRDLASSLLQFGAMAERYEVMSTVEDTFKAFTRVIEQRTYQPANPKLRLGNYKKGEFVEKGKAEGARSNVAKRMRKFMSMVFYDNEQITKGFLDKVTNGIITYSSLSYVAFNPFGNVNNLLMGKINNTIEAIGHRFFSGKAYVRANVEFDKRVMPDFLKRVSSIGSELGAKVGVSQRSDYDPKKPSSKWEGLVDFFRMMDLKSEIRENNVGNAFYNKSYFETFTDIGFYLQDAAEYNVQTKVGMAIVMDTNIMNKNTGDILSLYDAFEFDNETKSVKLKEGYDTIVTLDRKNVDENGKPKILREQEYNQRFIYNLHMKIREVNKEIHGNYARDDRAVLQSYNLGKLAFQFHKWVIPAMKARFRREYFDENLGWMEGRYRSFWSFLAYSFKEIAKANTEFTKYGENFAEQYGEEKLYNTYRTLGEIGIIMSTIAISALLSSLFADDDDDSDFQKRLENILLYQADRTYTELVFFIPGVGIREQYQMIKSPIAATRTLGELGEALYKTVETPLAYATMSKDEFRESSSIYYQRTRRKGELKLKKEWMDAVPILYTARKWNDYLNLTNFYVK